MTPLSYPGRSPYRYSADTLHVIARKLEAEPAIERQLLGAELRRIADAIYDFGKADEQRAREADKRSVVP